MTATADRWKTLKNTTHANVAFRAARCDDDLLMKLLRWLNAQSVSPVHEQQLDAHLEQLRRRRQGQDGLIEMAEKAGERYLSAFQLPRRFMPSYGFAEFDLGIYRMILSVDLLNAAGELGLPEEAGEFAEIFFVGAKLPEAPETPEQRDERARLRTVRLHQLVKDLARDFNVRFVFGGYMSFVARYVAWLEKARLRKKARLALPWELLWPLTYLPESRLDEASLKALPVHHAERVGSGTLVQVFEDLVNGYEDRYREAAHALGLRSVWELRPR